MVSTTSLTLDELLTISTPDAAAIADGKRRMTDLWMDRATDSLPIILPAPRPEHVQWDARAYEGLNRAERMLYEQMLHCVFGFAISESDAQLSVRANTGTGTLASIAGCTLIPSEYSLPWTNHITREAIEAFDPSTAVDSAGEMPFVHDYYDLCHEKLPTNVHPYCADSQGPFDLAHLLYGDEIFYAIYDEPGFVHALLEKVTILYIEGTKLIKSWMGEPLNSGYLGNAYIYMDNGGVRLCEDTSTLLNPESIAEFVLPYQQRALEAFGGGWVHYCGNNDALYAGVLANPAARGLNFGNPERHDFSRVIPDLIEAGMFYVGGLPRNDGETVKDYFRRVISYTGGTRKGLIFQPWLNQDEYAQHEDLIKLWRDLQ